MNILKVFLKLLAVVVIVLIISCEGKETAEEINEIKIAEAFDEIASAFNLADVDEIMEYYHPEYLHKGDTFEYEVIKWEIRRLDYFQISFSDFEYEFNGLECKVSFHMHLFDDTGEHIFVEPSENGDISYWLKDGNNWRVYGNQSEEGNPGFFVSVNSEPEGARVYLDDVFTYQITPITLHFLPQGVHKLRLYLEGYNEYKTSVIIPDEYFINVALDEPSYPLPTFILESPEQGEHFDDPIVVVEGIIRLIDQFNTYTSFDEEEYTLSLNNSDTILPVAQGEISLLATISEGANILQIRATSLSGNTGVSEKFIIYGDF